MPRRALLTCGLACVLVALPARATASPHALGSRDGARRPAAANVSMFSAVGSAIGDIARRYRVAIPDAVAAWDDSRVPSRVSPSPARTLADESTPQAVVSQSDPLAPGGSDPERVQIGPVTPATAPGGVPSAFPGAEGFGASSVGGRGGRVLEVTNLDDSGPGSLRAAIRATGPRIVVFRVGGTIALNSYLQISDPFITIAGQTAPGGGIALRAAPNGDAAALVITTHDVVVRYLRVRATPGASLGDEPRGISITGQTDGHACSANPDRCTYRVIIDHSSISWAVDQNMDIGYGAHDITIQWSLIAEGLYCSTHAQNDKRLPRDQWTRIPHSMGLLIDGPDSTGVSTYNLSIHHTLFANNDMRNPNAENMTGIFDFRNNVVYNWGQHAGSGSDVGAPLQFNYVDNYFKAGPNTSAATLGCPGDPRDTTAARSSLVPPPPVFPLPSELELKAVTGKGLSVFLDGNIAPGRAGLAAPEEGILRPDARKPAYYASSALPTPPMTTSSAAQAYADVLAGAGASKPVRDAADGRVVSGVKDGSGVLIDDPAQVGGYPSLAGGAAPADRDHDGMPDSWEAAARLNPDDAADGAGDRDGDGYTNVEEYLNSLA